MNTILISLIIAIAILYLKWFFAFLFYPLMALSALGSSQSNPKIKKIMRFPLRMAEHFLRFGGRFVLFQISTIPSVHLRIWLYKGLGVKWERT